MKSRKTFSGQGRLFEQRLSSFLNPAHKLFQLAHVLPWKQLEQELDSHFQDGPGQPPLPIRLVVGLLMLSHMCGLSDIQVVTPKELAKVISDTTVMEKNVRFPTDASLLNKSREKLVKLARKTGVKFRQSYTRIGLYMKRKVDSYAHAKQYKRMARGVKTLKAYLGREWSEMWNVL